MAAALEFLRDLERLAIPAAEAGDDDIVRALEQRDQHGKFHRRALQQLMHDEVIVADHGLDVADGGADFGDVLLAPLVTERIFDAGVSWP